MSDNKNSQTKVDAPDVQNTPFSLEDLDHILKSADADFESSLQDLQQAQSEGQASLELLDIDRILAEEESKTLKNRFLRIRRRIKNEMVFIFVKLKIFLIDLVHYKLPILAKWLLKSLKTLMGALGHFLTQFKSWSLSKKLASVGIGLLTVFVLFFIYKSITKGVLPGPSHLFVNSLDEWAEKTYNFEPNKDMESFYDSARVKQNIMSLKRIVVNVKPSQTSGPNPMAAFEFYIEGLSSDVTIELKDRESEILDLVQRMMEEKTFDELDSGEGKSRLNESVKKELNQFLTKGKVKRVYLKNAIVKP